MERLTFVPNDGRNAGLRGFCMEQDAINRLAAYEDTGLEPEEVEACKNALMGKSLAEIKEIEGIHVERIKVLAKAEAEGRLLVLPCKVGDTVYTLGYSPCHYGETHPDSYGCEGCHDPCDIEWAVREIPVRDIRWILLNAWEIMNGNYFMSREEAEAALKGEEE